MIWFKEAVVPTEIILEIIINTLTLEFHILSFGENSVIFFVLGYLSFSIGVFWVFFDMSNLQKSYKNRQPWIDLVEDHI